jgi:predicted RNase H-like nuclease
MCAMKGHVVLAKPKLTNRRNELIEKGYDLSILSNIDFVDAALCAVVAAEFRKDNYQLFGNREEGFIVVPTFQAQ